MARSALRLYRVWMLVLVAVAIAGCTRKDAASGDSFVVGFSQM